MQLAQPVQFVFERLHLHEAVVQLDGFGLDEFVVLRQFRFVASDAGQLFVDHIDERRAERVVVQTGLSRSLWFASCSARYCSACWIDFCSSTTCGCRVP